MIHDQNEDLSRPRRFAGALASELFDLLRKDVVAIPSEACTYWATIESARDTSLGVAMASLARHIRPLESFIGVEMWVRTKPCHEEMPLHFDKDETLAKQSGVLRFPAYSSVLYLTDEGGPTLVVDRQRVGEREVEIRYTSMPSANAFLVFPGHLLHGVLAEPERVGTSDGASRRRISLLMNWWTTRPLFPACADLPVRTFTKVGQRRVWECLPQRTDLRTTSDLKSPY